MLIGVMIMEDTIGRRIKDFRKRSGLTQKQLGEKIGVSGAMIGQYETGIRNPKKETLGRIADALQIPVGDFYVAAFRFVDGNYPERDTFSEMLIDVYDFVSKKVIATDLEGSISDLVGELDDEGKREVLKKALELFVEQGRKKAKAKDGEV